MGRGHPWPMSPPARRSDHAMPHDIIIKPRDVMPPARARCRPRTTSTRHDSSTRCSALFARQWICAGRRRTGRTSRAVLPPRGAGREHHRHARAWTARCRRSTTSAGTAARRLCVEAAGHVRRHHPVPVSRLDVRSGRPPGRRAAHGRSAAFPQGGLSAAPRPRRRLGRPHLHHTGRTARAADATSWPTCPASSRRGGCRTCGSATASSTTCAPTGS